MDKNNGEYMSSDNWTLEEILLSFYSDKKIVSGNSFSNPSRKDQESSDYTFPVSLRSDFDTLMDTFLEHYSLDSVPKLIKDFTDPNGSHRSSKDHKKNKRDSRIHKENKKNSTDPKRNKRDFTTSKRNKKDSTNPKENKSSVKSEGIKCSSNHKEGSTSNHKEGSTSNHKEGSTSNHKEGSASNHKEGSTSNHKEGSTSNHNGAKHFTDPKRCQRSTERRSSQSSQESSKDDITISSDSSSDRLIIDDLNDPMTVNKDVSFEVSANKSRATNEFSLKNQRNTILNGKPPPFPINHEASTSGVFSVKRPAIDPKATSIARKISIENSCTPKVFDVSSTIDISTSPDLFTSSSSEMDINSSAFQTRENSHLPIHQIVNDPYIPNASPYMVNSNDFYTPYANVPYIPNANVPYIPNANGYYVPNSNGLYMVNTNGSCMVNGSVPYIVNTTSPYVVNGTAGPHVINATGPFTQNANGSFISNSNNPFISNTNVPFRSNACNTFLPNTRRPFLPSLSNRCRCQNCQTMNPHYSDNFHLQFPPHITTYRHNPITAANSFVPTPIINSQTPFTPVTQPLPFRHLCTPTLPVSNTPQGDHKRICNICNCSHASSIHRRSNENDNLLSENNQMHRNNQFIRPQLASNRNYGPFRSSDNNWTRPRDRFPSSGASHRRVPSLRNLPKSSLNNLRPKGKKVTEKYGRACNNCQATLSRIWKYNEEGKPFCSTCRYFHVLHRGPLPMTSNIMKGRNQRASENRESEDN